jgi:hypothetical protein
MMALAEILDRVGPDTTSAAFIDAVERAVESVHEQIIVEFLPVDDCAAFGPRSIVVEIRGTSPAMALAVRVRRDDLVTPECHAFVRCLARAAATSCVDLDDSALDARPELVRRCRDLADSLGKARALLDFLGETSRTYLHDTTGLHDTSG